MKLKELFDNISDQLTNQPNIKLTDISDILNVNISDITHYTDNLDFNQDKYKRHLLFTNNYLDCYILTWLPTQETAFHSHPTKGCIYKIISGQLLEKRRIDPSELSPIELLLTRGQYHKICNDDGTHKMINTNTDKSISLHFYSPPNFY